MLVPQTHRRLFLKKKEKNILVQQQGWFLPLC
jgi:hypothetical protein